MNSLVEMLMSADVILALVFLAMAAVAELFLEHALKCRMPDHRVLHWYWEHILAPVARSAIMIGFVLIAYPALYGLRDAPAFALLFAGDQGRVVSMTNSVFVCSLLLPLLPGFERRAGGVLLVQGLVATAMVFGWYTAYIGAANANAWPGASAAITVAVLAWLGHRLSRMIGTRVGHYLDEALHTEGFDHIAPAMAALLGQAPTILVYGYLLGLQIAI